MDSHDIENYFRQHRKTLAVVFLVTGMLAVSGFFMGMRQTEKHATSYRVPQGAELGATLASSTADIPTAPTYKDIRSTAWLANRDWQFTLADLPHAAPEWDLVKQDPAELALAVADRKALRAYDGAPPVVPHTIDTISSASCLSCHGEGGTVIIGGTRPAEISHPWITNCTSCHVPADGLRSLKSPANQRLVVENTFLGRNSAGHGSRAYEGAPPTTPHPVWMRQNCMACHGPGREQAIRTSHPERLNCLQCHAPDADFDNRESYLGSPPPVVR
jgi:cytochrome c-type protein NapB